MNNIKPAQDIIRVMTGFLHGQGVLDRIDVEQLLRFRGRHTMETPRLASNVTYDRVSVLLLQPNGQ